MRTLLVLTLAACTSERAAVVAPPSASLDAGEASASVEPDAPELPGLGLGPPVSRALRERLAREAEAIPKGQLRKSPPADAERDGAIRKRYGDRCRLERTCGPIWGIDCEAAVDGPYYYVLPRADGWRQITVCGGACMGGRCTNCPPKNEGWTCETY